MTISRKRSNAKGTNAALRTASFASPSGTRDVLPPDAGQRTTLWQSLMGEFDLHGYQRLTTPPFEYSDVLERGLHAIDLDDAIRFIEPGSGRVAVLRPDITPQIARVIAARAADRPAPWRISYEGTVVRQRRRRARTHQQVLQCGIECVGMPGPDGDVEVFSVAAQACERVGIRNYLIELAQVRLASRVLEQVDEAARIEVTEALSAKDSVALNNLLKAAKAPAAVKKRLVTLASLYGDVSVLKAARRRLTDRDAERDLNELERVANRLSEFGLSGRLAIDLGDTRRSAYYTGVSGTMLADGPGEPIGAGGRYDRLLAQYGADLPATGFAFDVDNLAWALRAQGSVAPVDVRVLVCGGSNTKQRAEVATTLRQLGLPTATCLDSNHDQRLAYAQAWSFSLVATLERANVKFTRVADGAERSLQKSALVSASDLGPWAQEAQ